MDFTHRHDPFEGSGSRFGVPFEAMEPIEVIEVPKEESFEL
jgi:hypothetical protein